MPWLPRRHESGLTREKSALRKGKFCFCVALSATSPSHSCPSPQSPMVSTPPCRHVVTADPLYLEQQPGQWRLPDLPSSWLHCSSKFCLLKRASLDSLPGSNLIKHSQCWKPILCHTASHCICPCILLMCLINVCFSLEDKDHVCFVCDVYAASNILLTRVGTQQLWINPRPLSVERTLDGIQPAFLIWWVRWSNSLKSHGFS